MEFVYTRNSGNIAYYQEKDGVHGVEILEDGLTRNASGDHVESAVSTYYIKLWKKGEGVIKELIYRPSTESRMHPQKGNLDSVVVTNLMRDVV